MLPLDLKNIVYWLCRENYVSDKNLNKSSEKIEYDDQNIFPKILNISSPISI